MVFAVWYFPVVQQHTSYDIWWKYILTHNIPTKYSGADKDVPNILSAILFRSFAIKCSQHSSARNWMHWIYKSILGQSSWPCRKLFHFSIDLTASLQHGSHRICNRLFVASIGAARLISDDWLLRTHRYSNTNDDANCQASTDSNGVKCKIDNNKNMHRSSRAENRILNCFAYSNVLWRTKCRKVHTAKNI